MEKHTARGWYIGLHGEGLDHAAARRRDFVVLTLVACCTLTPIAMGIIKLATMVCK